MNFDQPTLDIIEQIGHTEIAICANSELAGNERKQEVIAFIMARLPEYVDILQLPPIQILKAWEGHRSNEIAVNFYQDYMVPALDDVQVFDTIAEFTQTYPSHKAKCPKCEGISTDYYQCNSGVIIDGRICTWRAIPSLIGPKNSAYIRIIIKEMFQDFPVPQLIFKPIELFDKEIDSSKGSPSPEIKRLV